MRRVNVLCYMGTQSSASRTEDEEGKKACKDLRRKIFDGRWSVFRKSITCDETWMQETGNRKATSTSPLPEKERLSKSAGKVMAIIFCDVRENVPYHLVPNKTTVNGGYYFDLIRSHLQRTV